MTPGPPSARVIPLALLCGTLLAGRVTAVGAQVPAPQVPLVELRGAHWFDGTRFVTGSRYMREGRFVVRGRATVDSVVDLRGRWIVPPYGDAHTHSPDGAWGLQDITAMYLRVGVFYVQVLANSRAGQREIRQQVNQPGTIDVSFANAAITSTGGHPQVLYESLGLFRRFWETLAEQQAAARSLARDRDVYERLDSAAQLEPIVQRLARDSVAVLKVMLLDSERWATRHRDTTQVGFYGMNPTLLAPLVQRAHALGRRVWAHVETPYDVEIALRDGVDGLAHVPGIATVADSELPALVIPDSTLRHAGARRILMTATLGLAAAQVDSDTAQRRRFLTVAVRNTRAMRAAGVRLLVGSDTYSNADIIRRDPRITAQYVGLTPLERLRMQAVDTPRAIFPQRQIGALAPGYEASALVLSCNPLDDAACFDAIGLRLKQGAWLSVPPAR